MADQMFRDVVQPFADAGRQRKYTVIVSVIAHAATIAIAIVVPVLATTTDLLPARAAIAAFAVRPPLPPSPPPLKIDAAARQVVVERPAAPVVAPDAIGPESAIPRAIEPLAGIDFSQGLVSGGEYTAEPAPSSIPAVTAPPQAPVRPGSDIRRPVKVKDVVPVYPPLARAGRVEGIVIVEATIDPSGKVQDARILRSIPLLDAAALDAVRQWEYTPTLLNGAPVAVVMTVTVRFQLQ